MALDVSYGEQSTQKEKRTEGRPLGKLISKGKKKSCLPEKLKGNAEVRRQSFKEGVINLANKRPRLQVLE